MLSGVWAHCRHDKLERSRAAFALSAAPGAPLAAMIIAVPADGDAIANALGVVTYTPPLDSSAGRRHARARG